MSESATCVAGAPGVAQDGPDVAARVAAFWGLVDVGSTGECWPWTGAISGKGYGYFRHRRAHRVAYELTCGPIEAGRVIDHVCRNRLCCNPAHMEPVTNRENVLRGEHPNAVTHRTGTCQRGHSMTDAKVTRKGRECRECIRLRDAAYRAGGSAHVQ